MSEEKEHEQNEVAPEYASLVAMMDRWFANHFHGSIVARDVDVYSHVRAAVEELKQKLRDLFSERTQ